MVSPTAPDGGGFLINMYPWRAWASGWQSYNGVAPGDEFLVIRDSNLDGVTDETVILTWEAYDTARQYYDNVNPYYH